MSVIDLKVKAMTWEYIEAMYLPEGGLGINMEPGKNTGRIKAAIAAPEKYHYHIR
jgi:hypothetical protein